MAGDEYFSSAGPLKLRGVNESGIKKKKKKKDKDRKKEAQLTQVIIQDEESTSKVPMPMKTDAERKFEERKRKREEERILKKASKTHKEKVEEFNRHLDSLTEHFDIPKVSWTK